MRILPILHNYNNVKSNRNAQTKFESSNINNHNHNNHKYTGVASADLAYVSMFDSNIAKDLKLMGLI